MIPNVADALQGWMQPVLVKTVTTSTVDFQQVTVVTGKQVDAVIQPTQKTKLNAEPWTGHSRMSPCTVKNCWNWVRWWNTVARIIRLLNHRTGLITDTVKPCVKPHSVR